MPKRYILNISLTTLASSLLITRSPVSSLSYPMKRAVFTIPSPRSNFFFKVHLLFSLMLRLSSCAKEASTVIISSPSEESVLILFSSKSTPTPISFSSLVYLRTVVVFLANLEIDFVIIRSIFPALQSAIIL